MPDSTQRYVNVLFDKPVIEAIDDFRFTYRLESRTDAIRKLIEYALKHKKEAARG
jgi:metal-responsive CopG/Arc/MetJ family transcriptional regulator